MKSSEIEIKEHVRNLSSWFASNRKKALQELLYTSSNTDSHSKIGDEGAIPALLRLLRDADTEVRRNAATILRNIANRNQQLIAKASAISRLVKLLRDEDTEVRRHVVSTLMDIANKNQRLVAQAGAIPPLVELLRDANTEVKRCAAGALRNIANNIDNQRLVAEAGAIPPLVELLRDANTEVKRCAAGALWNIANNTNNRRLVAEAGAIPLLVDLLRDVNTVVRGEAAGALWNIARNTDNQRLVAEAGAIPLLVDLLRDTDTEVKRYAAGALWSITRNIDNQRLVAEAGAIPLLVELLRSTNMDNLDFIFSPNADNFAKLRTNVVGALWNIVQNNTPNKKALINTQGISILQSMIIKRNFIDTNALHYAERIVDTCKGIIVQDVANTAIENITHKRTPVVSESRQSSSNTDSALEDFLNDEQAEPPAVTNTNTERGPEHLHADTESLEPIILLAEFQRMQEQLATLQAQPAPTLSSLDTQRLQAMIAQDSAQEIRILEQETILTNEDQRVYYQAIRLHISELVVAATGIASGYIDVNNSVGAKAIGWVCDAMSSYFPGFSTVTSAVKVSVSVLDAAYRKHFIKAIRILGPTVSEADILGAELARLLVRANFHAARPLSVKAAERDTRRLISGVIRSESNALTAIELFHFVWDESSYCLDPMIPVQERELVPSIPITVAAAVPTASSNNSTGSEVTREAFMQEKTARKALQDEFSELQKRVAFKTDTLTQQDFDRLKTEFTKQESNSTHYHTSTHGQMLLRREEEAYPSIQAANEQIRLLQQLIAQQGEQIRLLTEAVQLQREDGDAVSAKVLTQIGHFGERAAASAVSANDELQKTLLFGDQR